MGAENKPQGFVYFIYAAEFNAVKVGYSARPDVRLTHLQVSIPCDLELLGVMPGSLETESSLHKEFFKSHMRGEWFFLDDYVKARIECLIGVSMSSLIQSRKAQRPLAYFPSDGVLLSGPTKDIPSAKRLRQEIIKAMHYGLFIFESKLVEVTGIKKEDFKRWRKQGLIEYLKLGHEPRYMLRHIDQMIEDGFLK